MTPPTKKQGEAMPKLRKLAPGEATKKLAKAAKWWMNLQASFLHPVGTLEKDRTTMVRRFVRGSDVSCLAPL